MPLQLFDHLPVAAKHWIERGDTPALSFIAMLVLGVALGVLWQRQHERQLR